MSYQAKKHKLSKVNIMANNRINKVLENGNYSKPLCEVFMLSCESVNDSKRSIIIDQYGVNVVQILHGGEVSVKLFDVENNVLLNLPIERFASYYGMSESECIDSLNNDPMEVLNLSSNYLFLKAA